MKIFVSALKHASDHVFNFVLGCLAFLAMYYYLDLSSDPEIVRAVQRIDGYSFNVALSMCFWIFAAICFGNFGSSIIHYYHKKANQ